MSEHDKRLDTIAPSLEPFHWSRRSFALTLVTLAMWRVGASRAIAQVYAPAPTDYQAPVQVEWELPRRYVGAVARDLGARPDQIRRSPNDPPHRGPPLLVIIIGAFLLVKLVEAIIDAYRKLRYGGLVVVDDGRGDVKIRHDVRLKDRAIIIKDKNGITLYELRGESATTEGLLKTLPTAKSRGRLPPGQS